MPSKFDLLREGQAVHVEPGVKARLNKDKKRLELSTGEYFDVGHNRDLFPENEKQLGISKEKEQIQHNIGKSPLGEFGYDVSQKGVLGGAKDWVDYATAGDQYANRKAAQAQVSQQIAEESPWTSRAGTGASIAADIALTRKLPARQAGPLLTTASAGSRVLTEPGEVGKEAAFAAIGGHALDKLMGGIGRATARRAESRAMPGRQEAVRNQNRLGQQANEALNATERRQFNAAQERVTNENAARTHQYNLELTDRKNQMIKSQQAHSQAEAAHAGNVNALKAQAKADQKAYEAAVKNLPEVQKEAQAKFSQGVLKNVEEIESSFPKNSKIYTDQLGVNQFIDESINSTGLAGSAEGSKTARILKTLIPDGEILTSRELAKRYQAIEEAIQRGNPEVQQVLSQYKEFLGNRLPGILEDTVAYEKIIPSLEKTLESEMTSLLKQFPLGQSGSSINELAKSNLKSALRDISPDQFVQKLQSGEIAQILKDRLLTVEDLFDQIGVSNVARLKKTNVSLYEGLKRQNNIDSQHAFFVSEMGKKIDNAIARSEIKATSAAGEAGFKLKQNVKGTYGLAEPVQPPTAPQAPNIPPAPIAAAVPPVPSQPGLMGNPTPPIPRPFNAQPEPNLAPPRNMAESAGDFLEKPALKGQGMDSLIKLGALKYALGPAALPLEAGAAAAYGAGKLLTSPGSAGNVARMSFKQGGIQAIEMLAQKYPSYHDGVLEDPRERRSLTKEIENDPEIPLEQKAMIQSKINRGRPLSLPLQ